MQNFLICISRKRSNVALPPLEELYLFFQISGRLHWFKLADSKVSWHLRTHLKSHSGEKPKKSKSSIEVADSKFSCSWF